MLSELYELLPEAGDLERPKIAFFFDEAHLLFRDAPRALVEKIEQIVRLIRSKGVSVWFITQNPADIPESVLGQIGNRVQHALRAYTPNEQKALKYAAMSFRANPSFDTESALQELAVGEALVSVLDEKGTPTVVERAGILPPRSSMNAVDDAALRSVIISDPLCEKYTAIVDRESAYEKISAERERAEEEAAAAAEEAEKKREEEKRQKEKEAARKKSSSSRKTSAVGRAASSAANSFGRELGREIFRGIFGTYKR